MTLTALITINTILAGTVVFAIVWLLGSAIRRDRDTRSVLATIQGARRHERSARIAA
jgi:hypothetical protein